MLFFPEQDQAEAVTAFRRRLLGTSLLGGLALAAVVALLARSTVRPVTALAHATRRIARGELDAPLPPIRSVDEVGRLTESFGEMQRALVRHVEQIRDSAAEKERLESDLRIASQIQMSHGFRRNRARLPRRERAGSRGSRGTRRTLTPQSSFGSINDD